MKLRVMVVDESAQRETLLLEALEQEGYEVVSRVPNVANLFEEVLAAAPDIVIVDMESPDRDTLEQMRTLHDAHPKPVVMFADDGDSSMIRDAVRAGVSAYVVDGLSKERLQPILEVAVARFNKFQELKRELEQTRTSLNERKIIDRAKGILMVRRNFSEQEAYQALRKQAMNTNKRIVEVAQNIIDAAELLG